MNLFKFIQYYLLLLFCPMAYLAQTGPAGIGSNTNNRFWLDANRIGQANNTAVASWTNVGGNTTNADQATAANRPTHFLNVLNGYPAVRFDMTNDRLTFANNTDLNNNNDWIQRTFFFAFTTGANVTTRQVVFEEGGTIRGLNFYIFNGNIYAGAWNVQNDGAGSPWNFASVNTTIAANTSYILSFIYNGNDAITGNITLYLNGVLFGTISNVGRLYAHNPGMIGAKEADTYYETGTSSGTGEYFGGYVSEMIQYNYNVNSAERLIIQNYLAAKYGLTLGVNDIYTQDNVANGNYDHEVAGIGRIDASNLNTAAQGTSILKILNASNLTDDKFLIWGHNNGLQLADNGSDVPSPVQARFSRVWRASEVNVSGASVDVGSVDVQFDLTNLGSVTASHLRLLVDVNNNGIFSDDAPIGGATLVSGNIYQFSAVTQFTNGSRFTLGTTSKFLTPLPIELINWEANCSNSKTELKWTTASETNNKLFTIQKSNDAATWKTLSTVDGNINSKISKNYSFIDAEYINSTTYYKLKQTDVNGELKYSKIISVNCNETENGFLSVFPNPSLNKISFHVQNISSTNAMVKLFDSHGKLVLEQSINSPQADINTSQLPQGIYIISLYLNDEKIETKRVVLLTE